MKAIFVGCEYAGATTLEPFFTDKVANGPGSTVEIYGTHGALDYKLLIEKAGGEVTQEELYGRTEGIRYMEFCEAVAREVR